MLTRIVIEQIDPDNHDIRVYHVDGMLSCGTAHVNVPLQTKDIDDMHACGGVADNVLRMIESFPGIECLMFQRHSLEVHKGGAFSWAEVEPHVIHALTAALSDDLDTPVEVSVRGYLAKRLEAAERKARRRVKERAEASIIPPSDTDGTT